MTNIVEAVAKALKDAGVYGRGATAPDLARAAISAHTAALAEAGFVIMPREPTDAVVAAALECFGLPSNSHNRSCMRKALSAAVVAALATDSREG